ncbi:uncharacterized protein K460DRAFT_273449 [Cucurbitaria berberidis CBS 394.84]|uniref:Uncharacterized protein n=1 Tax=Cucurbitaria berberidis CBS 394.84 TaxID=1168544 RepID=A0A9P4GRA3_9PLEO|nr:uncharacterized protein K460DRAFT_273449 [Cucurbitaria berberidis CBS 394.84]KAF1851268.1 hypothetical protein K460DRAFT_273449 [Cucurbitaria berberidis CBS 394.84]
MAEIPSEPPLKAFEGKLAIVTGHNMLVTVSGTVALSVVLVREGFIILCLDPNLEWAQDTVEMILAKFSRQKEISVKSDVTVAPDCRLLR